MMMFVTGAPGSGLFFNYQSFLQRQQINEARLGLPKPNLA
jgi:hypothetical protein